MSSPWSEAEVEATLNFGNIGPELRANLERAVAIATRACENHFKRLERTARQSAERAGQHWDRAADRAERAGSRMETRLGRSFAATALDAQRSAARVADSYDQAFDRTARQASVLRERINQALRGIDRAEVRLTIDARDALANLRAVHRQMQSYLTANPLTVRMRVADNIIGAAGANEQLDRIARNRRSTIHVNTRGGTGSNAAMRGVSEMASGLGGMSSGVLSAVSSVAKLSAIAGTATIAIGAAVPAAAALASALVSVGVAGGGIAAAGLTAALVGAGALKTGLSGVSDALGAIGATSSGGGGAAAVDTARQVEQAQKALTRAVRDEQKAQRDVAIARKDAQEKLEDLHLEMRGATLSERDAVLSLKEAQSDLAKGGFADQNERERAILRVDEAEQRLLEVRERNNDLAKETADADRKGIENSDEVVAAKEKLADATDAVKDARLAVADAQKGSGGGGGGGIDKLGDAMAKLAPNAREFVQTLIDLQPAWNAVQQRVQNRLFAGLSGEVRELAGNYLPQLTTSLSNAVGGFNDGALSALRFTNSATGMSVVNQLLAKSSDIAGNFGRTLGNLVPGFAAIGASASNVFAPMSKGMAEAASRMSESLVQAQQSGKLDETFQRALVVAKQLGAVLGELGSIIGGVFRAASAAGNGNGLANITNSLKSISDWVNGPVGQGALTSFFQSVGAAVSAIMPLFLQVAGIIGGQVAPMIANLITTLAPAIEPVISAIGMAVAALAPAIGPLATAFGSILTAVAPLVPVIAQLVSAFVQIAGPIITQLANALAPILASLGPILGDVLSAIAPVLAEVAGAVVQLLDAVGPLLPVLGDAFVTVLGAVLPILGQLASILGPILATAVTALVPVISTIATTFAQVLEAVSPLLPVLGDALTQILAAVMPLIQQMAGLWSQMVMALLPLVPPLIQIVEALLPPLLQVVIALLPVMFTMATAFVNIMTAIAPVIVVVAQLAAGFAGLLGTIIGWGADALGAVTNFANNVVTFVSQLPGRITGALGGMWDGLVSGFKTALNALIGLWNNFSLGVDFTIPIINKRVQFSIDTPNIPLFAQGGRVPMMAGAVRGQDSILAGIAPDEYIEPANRVTPQTLPLLDAIRAGWTPSPDQLRMLLATGSLPGFAAGGKVPGKAAAEAIDPASYLMGGFSMSAIDCSGLVSYEVNDIVGLDRFDSRMSTVSEGSWLANKGFVQGKGGPGDVTVGWYDHGGGAFGHTAITLSDGTNVESNGSEGVVVGGPVGGFDDMFEQFMHLPAANIRGGDAGAQTSMGTDLTAPGAAGGGGAPAAPGSAGGAGGTGGSGGSGGTSGGGIPSLPPVGTGGAGVGVTSSSTMPFGQARADTWLREQDFGSQARGWGTDAIKEIGSDFLAPTGLESIYGSIIDRVVEAIEKAQPPAANVSVTDKTRGGVQVTGTPNTRTTYRG
ncbi:hypothetical protein OG579_17130 [Williamsia herbipolensis]|uniref:NlpC/P60 domain-containing protein n=1 Tax=Williamsia herbipolensis TaxID=1603258 RepID=A0AAU4K047_9NOCA|nr:hypothetical protein [Williamsia herbipolensis]